MDIYKKRIKKYKKRVKMGETLKLQRFSYFCFKKLEHI